MSKFWVILSRITYASALSLMLVTLFWLIYPYRIIDVESPLPTSSNVVNREQVLVSTMTYTKYTDLRPTNVTKSIICEDGNLVTLAAGNGNGLPQGTRTLEVETVVPAKTSKSICAVHWRVEFKPNPIRVITVWFQTEPFVVI